MSDRINDLLNDTARVCAEADVAIAAAEARIAAAYEGRAAEYRRLQLQAQALPPVPDNVLRMGPRQQAPDPYTPPTRRKPKTRSKTAVGCISTGRKAPRRLVPHVDYDDPS